MWFLKYRDDDTTQPVFEFYLHPVLHRSNRGDVKHFLPGFGGSKDHTCIGDTVNYGARLEGLGKYYKTSIIIDEDCYKRTYGLFVRELDTVRVKGRVQASPIFELIGLEDEATPEQKKMLRQYAAALAIYRDGDFVLAAKKFQQLFRDFPEDGASEMMLERCRHYLVTPPTTKWTGIHVMEDK